MEQPVVDVQHLQKEEAISIVIVRGPYSSRDDGRYEQLEEFIQRMNEMLPGLIIMVRYWIL